MGSLGEDLRGEGRGKEGSRDKGRAQQKSIKGKSGSTETSFPVMFR